ncbi:hypothetical protein ZWY2020_006514, partial [Hordeum vulgare]
QAPSPTEIEENRHHHHSTKGSPLGPAQIPRIAFRMLELHVNSLMSFGYIMLFLSNDLGAEWIDHHDDLLLSFSSSHMISKGKFQSGGRTIGAVIKALLKQPTQKSSLRICHPRIKISLHTQYINVYIKKVLSILKILTSMQAPSVFHFILPSDQVAPEVVLHVLNPYFTSILQMCGEILFTLNTSETLSVPIQILLFFYICWHRLSRVAALSNCHIPDTLSKLVLCSCLLCIAPKKISTRTKEWSSRKSESNLRRYAPSLCYILPGAFLTGKRGGDGEMLRAGETRIYLGEWKEERQGVLIVVTGGAGRESMVNYSRIIGEVMVLMKNHSVSESPLREGTRTCPRWDLAETEACGGGKVLEEKLTLFLKTLNLSWYAELSMYPINFVRVYMKRENADSWNSGLKRSKFEIHIPRNSKSRENQRGFILEFIKNIGQKKYQRGASRNPQAC